MINYNNSFTGLNVKYYEQFFLSEEKLEKEVDYVKMLFDRHSGALPDNDRTLLDIGCGTGAHVDKFSQSYNRICAVDMSQDMIAYAKAHHAKQNIKYLCKDVSANLDNNKIGEVFSNAVSLAHVIGYMKDNISLNNYFQFANASLQIGGIFIFNYYNLLGVISSGLNPRSVTKGDEETEVTRISNASMDYNKQSLKLDYFYIVKDKGQLISYEIHEMMRCFTRMEIELLLVNNGFKVMDFLDWGSENKMSSQMWNSGCVAIKQGEISNIV